MGMNTDSSEAYDNGYLSYNTEEPCPYDIGTLEYSEWLSGWNDAEYHK